MEPDVVKSEIAAVTVYRRGALVTRRARVSRGENGYPGEIRIEGLPLALDDGSLRLSVGAVDDAASPIAGDVRLALEVPQGDPDLADAEDVTLRKAQLEYSLAQRALDDLDDALRRTATLEVGERGRSPKGQPPLPSPTEARLGLLEFRRQRMRALHKSRATAVLALHDAEQRLATARERQRTGSDARNARAWESRKAAVVRFESPGGPQTLASEIDVQLRYFVPGARWAPSYTIRLGPQLAGGRLEMRAMVSQMTGEDWRNVPLTLSTASPQQWTELPELQSLRIGRVQPTPAKTGWRPAPTGEQTLYADYDRDLPRDEDRRRLLVQSRSIAVDEIAAAGEDLFEQEEVLERELYRGAPPPAMAPPPAPTGMPAAMPVAAAAPASPVDVPPAARSAGLGALLGDAIDGAFGGGGPQRKRSIRGEPPTEPPAADPGVVAGRDLLDYGRLCLWGPGDPRRGRLQRVEARVSYAQVSLHAVRIEVALGDMEVAAAEAERIDRCAPPPGYHSPDAEGGFDYAYLCDAPITVDSDGRFHAVPIRAHDVASKARYVAVPRESQDVFRLVEFANPMDAPLLPGPADVYVDGKFALTTQVGLTPTSGRLELGLGVEQAIKLARNVAFAEDTSGLIKRNTALVHTIEIDIANRLPSAATIEVRERLPVVPEDQRDDVEVELLRVAPPWEDYEQRDPPLQGGHAWHVTVPAGGNKSLVAQWSATVSQNSELVGGNRRDA